MVVNLHVSCYSNIQKLRNLHRILVATFVYRSMRNSWRRTLRTLARSVGPCRPSTSKCTNGGSRRWGLLTAIRQCRDWGPNSQVVVHGGLWTVWWHEPSNSSCLLPNIVSDQHRESTREISFWSVPSFWAEARWSFLLSLVSHRNAVFTKSVVTGRQG
jgi:hypothetical protein